VFETALSTVGVPRLFALSLMESCKPNLNGMQERRHSRHHPRGERA
jgi:hypothetical protein